MFTAQGYLGSTTQDSVSAAGRDSGLNPTPADIATYFYYDAVGNLTREIDGRGIETDYTVNALNEVVQITHAAAHTANANEPLTPVDFAYIERFFYDYNDNEVLHQVEDRGNTSGVDGNLPSGDLPSVAPNPDPVGGTAFEDTVTKFDILDEPIETVQEVGNGAAPLHTRTRYDANGNAVLTIEPAGNASASVYDERDLLFQSTDGASSRPSAGLYGPSDPTTFDRPGGSGTASSTTTYNYDVNGNLIETVDAVSQGGTTSTIAGSGDVYATSYDGFDRAKVETDPLGNQTINTYDPASNIVRVITKGDPLIDGPGSANNVTLQVTEYVFDELNRDVATSQVLFLTPNDAPVRSVTLTDNATMDGLAVYLADAPSHAAAVPGASDITVLGRVTTLNEYDRDSRETFTVQDNMDVSRDIYDGVGRDTQTIDSALSNGFSAGSFNPANLSGNSMQTAYDAAGNPIEELQTDETSVANVGIEQFRTTMFYDSLDHLQETVDNVGHDTEDRYDSRGDLVATADANGPVTGTINRRGLGSSATVTINAPGDGTETYYDGLGREVESDQFLTATGQGTGFLAADVYGQKQTIPTGYLDTTQAGDGMISTYYAWDADSQLLAQRDDNDNTTGYIYDDQGRLKDQREGLNITGTSFSLTGGDSGSFDVALRGGVTPVDTQPNGTDDVMSYNADEEETGITDQRGDVFVYTHDALGRQTSLTITPASGVTGTTFQQWRYDGLSRVTATTDNNNPSTSNDDVFVDKLYDSLSREVEEWQSPWAGYLNYISYSFDVNTSGSMDQPSATIYPDGRQVDSTYDELDRLVSKTDHGYTKAIGTYQYLGPDQVAVRTYENNTRLTYIGQNADVGYDAEQRVINQRWESFTTGTALGAGTLIEGFGVLDASGNPAYDRDNRPLISEHQHDPGNSEVYTYGSSGELTSFNRGTLNSTKTAIATPTTTPGAVQTQTWGLDGNGNWTSTTVTTGGTAATENRTSSDYNAINAISGTPYGADVTGTPTYDADGNMTNDGVGTYAWDALGRVQAVTRIKNNLLAAVYTYDADGRVMSRTVTNGGLPNKSVLNGTTYFYYDGSQVIQENDANNNDLQQYVYGNGPQEVWTLDNRRSGITVAQLNGTSGTARMFYLSDMLGTVTGLTDEGGLLKEAYQYDAYGRQTVIDDGPDADKIVNFTSDDVRTTLGTSLYGNPFMFQGQRLSPETGLMSFGGTNELYDQSEGRFRRRDPMQDDATNLYAFVENGPTYAVDPSAAIPVGDTENASIPRLGPIAGVWTRFSV